MAEEFQLNAVVSKKRKMYAELETEELLLAPENSVEEPENSVEEQLPENCSTISPVTSVCETEMSAGGYSTPSPDLENAVDLQTEESEAEVSTYASCDAVFSREASPASQLSVETGRPAARPRRENPAAKMPSAAELEDFFAEIEKSHQKHFIEKYNYDIVKDEPLEGKYEWVLLKGSN